jgi:hypothetical protein
MNLNRAKIKAEGSSHRFCALEYRPSGWDGPTQVSSPVILFVLRNRRGDLQFRVHPEWRLIVQSKDLLYLQSLFQDFLERAQGEPEKLLVQVSSLGVGPLVTKACGADLKAHPELHELSSAFVQL